MNIDFQAVPEFFRGQPISATDINNLRHNILTANNVMTAPQPLFMDTHIYAPKALPLTWRGPEFDIWEGAFMYREGMQKAYLGFHLKLDGLADITGEFPLSTFNDVAIAVIVKHTTLTYQQAFTQTPRFTRALEVTDTTTRTFSDSNFWYRFRLKDGHGVESPPTDTINGYEYITPNSRVSEIEIDVSLLDLQDGEIVPIKLVIVAHKNPMVLPTNANRGDGYTILFHKFFFKSGLNGRQVAQSHIFYSMLYAQTDGDLSYSDNWPTASFVSSGENVLSVNNLALLTRKQRYIVERLRNRPMPMTGSLFYISAWGGTSSVRYPAKDVVPGQWDFYKSTYSIANKYNSNDDEDVFNVNEVVDMAYSFNAQSTLATFAWNPYFPLYDGAFVNFKFYGNTEARQVMIVDFTEQPVSSTSIRRNVLYWLNPGVGRQSGHLTGYFDANISGVRVDYTGYYGSVFADHQTLSNVLVTTLGQRRRKVYLNRMYNVRIPSDTTPVYSPEFGRFSTQSGPQAKYFLTKGLWEDSVEIKFAKDTTFTDPTSRGRESWRLVRDNSGFTLNYGFVGNAPESVTMDGFVDRFKPLNKTEKEAQYKQVSAYNGTNWRWITEAGQRGWSQVFLNLYDHSKPTLNKANYISYCNVLGMSVYNRANRLYSVPAEYEPNEEITYANLRTLLGDIDSDLTYLYENMFISNPHFRRYDMYWGSPKSVLALKRLFGDYNKKFYYVARQRLGNILIVRGQNVTLYYGEVSELKREEDPNGSLHEMSAVGVKFEHSTSIISGDEEQTVVFHLSNIEDLAYNQYYYLQGDSIIYAAEFYEEPS
jgi:hypothetical protein